MPELITCEQIADELGKMTQLSARDPGIMQKMLGTRLCVLYEFIEGDTIRPYHLVSNPDAAFVAEGTLDYESCDVVIRTTPDGLYRILKGDLGGREAIVNGILDIRKAPSMSKLLVMRGLFNRYRKSTQRTAEAAA